MKTLKFRFGFELFNRVEPLAVAKFFQSEEINKIFEKEGEINLIAVRISDNAICQGCIYKEIFFSTGYKLEKGENTQKYYTFSYETKQGEITNLKKVQRIEFEIPSMYFIQYSEDKIYNK